MPGYMMKDKKKKKMMYGYGGSVGKKKNKIMYKDGKEVPELTAAQKTLPDALKDEIIKSKKKKMKGQVCTVLEYVAAANAAYAVIRKAVENGRELTSVGKQIAAFTHATDDLSKHAHKKKNSIWSAFTGKDESDLEEFMALEELKQKENELKQMMIYLGRPGLHSDYVRFCVEARKKRQEAAKEKERRWAAFVEGFQTWFLVSLFILVGLGVLVGGVWILRYKGII